MEQADRASFTRGIFGSRGAVGYGKPLGHWGGRLLWHLPEKEKLLVRWRICAVGEADMAETKAIADFKSIYAGRRPYANLAK